MSKRVLLFAVLFLLPVVALAGYALPALGLGPSAPSPVAALSAGTVLDTLEATLGEIYAGVSPSVVNIRVMQSAAAVPAGDPEIPGFPFDPSIPQGGLGSGFVWDREGHIVTNNHVVEGADGIMVAFSDDTTVPAEVVGADPHSDLAVIKVDLPPEKLDPVEVADSTNVKVGQLAVAIGNPLDSLT